VCPNAHCAASRFAYGFVVVVFVGFLVIVFMDFFVLFVVIVFMGPTEQQKARSQQRNGLDIALVGLRGDCLGDFTSHLQRKDALASPASNRAFVSNAFT